MARRNVDDDVPMFRVVVRLRAPRKNPEYVAGDRFYFYDGPEYSVAYGPYGLIGTARGVLSNKMGFHADAFVDGWIEKAAVEWERVS